MFSFLKNHPFAVEAFFESSLVFTFAVPKEQIQHLIPELLELDTFQEKWAFIAVAMVQTKALRPKGFPRIFGNDFFLIGYRVFVRYTNQAGKSLRGLYILKSETDKKKMEFFGNIFTYYNYTTTDIIKKKQNGISEIHSDKSGFKIKIDDQENENIPLPFTFTVNPVNREILIIEGVRENWKPVPVKVVDYNFSFIHNLKLNDVRLANAFVIRNIPYYWKKGKIERWK